MTRRQIEIYIFLLSSPSVVKKFIFIRGSVTWQVHASEDAIIICFGFTPLHRLWSEMMMPNFFFCSLVRARRKTPSFKTDHPANEFLEMKKSSQNLTNVFVSLPKHDTAKYALSYFPPNFHPFKSFNSLTYHSVPIYEFRQPYFGRAQTIDTTVKFFS